MFLGDYSSVAAWPDSSLCEGCGLQDQALSWMWGLISLVLRGPASFLSWYCTVCKEQKAALSWAGAGNNTRVTWLWEAESQANDFLSLQILMISLMMTILTRRSSGHHPNCTKSGHTLTHTHMHSCSSCHRMSLCYTQAVSNVSTESNLCCDWLIGAGFTKLMLADWPSRVHLSEL